MNKYVFLVFVSVIALTALTLWYGSMPEVGMDTLTPSVSVSPIPISLLAVPAGGVRLPMPVRASAPTQTQGTVIFTITDKAESLDNFQYILVQLSGVSVHKSGGQWVTMKNTPPLFDLLKLYKMEQANAFLAELNLDAGTYDQFRFDIGSLVLVTKDGVYHEAKVPSRQIRLTINLIVEKGNKSSVSVDIMSDKSIHRTGDGKYIFTPVLNLETRSKLSQTQVLINGLVTLIGGKTDMSMMSGMDENGDIRRDFMFDANTEFEILGNAIRVIPKEESQSTIKIIPQQAIDLAIQSGNLTSVISLKTTRRANKLVWQVRGVKSDGNIGIVYLDVVTGAVTGTE
ncbi:MAG: DUF4382 domain-containing protein [bacterium]|nr:DUF4382 domain-containing protein [bacterium]MDZ4285579.1 DUF4382 domain-containing protein [Candidatus Sungbacteria bacterium]